MARGSDFMSGKRNKMFFLSKEDYESMQEILYLISIPGMEESILEGMQQDVNLR
jgi:antitoxin YefM